MKLDIVLKITTIDIVIETQTLQNLKQNGRLVLVNRSHFEKLIQSNIQF